MASAGEVQHAIRRTVHELLSRIAPADDDPPPDALDDVDDAAAVSRVVSIADVDGWVPLRALKAP